MTHERERGDEPTGGPPLDDRLGLAADIPVSDGPGVLDEDIVNDDLVVVFSAGALQERSARQRLGGGAAEGLR